MIQEHPLRIIWVTSCCGLAENSKGSLLVHHLSTGLNLLPQVRTNNSQVPHRTNIAIYAHESPSKHSNIDEEAMDGTAQAFLDLFVKRGWGAQMNLKAKLVEVRFVYRHEEIVSSNNKGIAESAGSVTSNTDVGHPVPRRFWRRFRLL